MKVWCLLMVVLASACADDSHPDTGVGANEAVPAQIDCMSLCTRSAECVVRLCDEDKDTTRYEALLQDVIDDCTLQCDDDAVRAQIGATAWKCVFMDTCRSVFEHDTCDVNASYTCK